MLALYVDCAVIPVWTSIAFCSMYFCYCIHGCVCQLVIKENDDDDDLPCRAGQPELTHVVRYLGMS